MAVATSSPTRLLEAKSAGTRSFSPCLRALCAAMMSSAASRTRGFSEGRRGSRCAFLHLGAQI
jgi:hypothetical protein